MELALGDRIQRRLLAENIVFIDDLQWPRDKALESGVRPSRKVAMGRLDREHRADGHGMQLAAGKAVPRGLLERPVE